MPLQRSYRYGDRPPRIASMHFNDGPLFLSELPDTPTRASTPSSGRSTSCSISSLSSINSSHSLERSTQSIDIRRPCWPAPPPIPASPAEGSFSDSISVRSLKLRLRPRIKLSRFFHRKSASDGVQETIDFTASCSSSFSSDDYTPTSRKSYAVPRLQNAMPSPPRSRRQTGSTSPSPLPKHASRLPCTPCYYFVARNCHGYVLGGGGEDACDHCAAAGFLGAL